MTNIHLIADEVDRAIITLGEVFSLNQHVGQRTRSSLPAGRSSAARSWTRWEAACPSSPPPSTTPSSGAATRTSKLRPTRSTSPLPGGLGDDRGRRPTEVPQRLGRRDPHQDVITRHLSDGVVLQQQRRPGARGRAVGGSSELGVVGEGPTPARCEATTSFDFRSRPTRCTGNGLGINDTRQVQGAREGWSVRVTARSPWRRDHHPGGWFAICPSSDVRSTLQGRRGSQACPTTTTTHRPPHVGSTRDDDRPPLRRVRPIRSAGDVRRPLPGADAAATAMRPTGGGDGTERPSRSRLSSSGSANDDCGLLSRPQGPSHRAGDHLRWTSRAAECRRRRRATSANFAGRVSIPAVVQACRPRLPVRPGSGHR